MAQILFICIYQINIGLIQMEFAKLKGLYKNTNSAEPFLWISFIASMVLAQSADFEDGTFNF